MAGALVAVLVVVLGAALRSPLARGRRRSVGSVRWGAIVTDRSVIQASWAGWLGAAGDRLTALRRPPGADESGDLAELRAVVAAGGSLDQAFSALARGSGPWSAPARAVVVAARRGRPLQDGLDAWAGVAGDDEVVLLAAALGIAGATGGSHGLALHGVAEAVAQRRCLQREIRALSSQARASAAVLVLTPVVFALVVALVDGRVRTFWTASLVGPCTLAAGLLLDLAGGVWMASLVRRVR